MVLGPLSHCGLLQLRLGKSTTSPRSEDNRRRVAYRGEEPREMRGSCCSTHRFTIALAIGRRGFATLAGAPPAAQKDLGVHDGLFNYPAIQFKGNRKDQKTS